MDPYRFTRILIAFLTVAISCAFAYLLLVKAPGGGNNSVTEIIDAAKNSLVLDSATSCNPVIRSCEIEITKEEAICNPEKLSTDIKTEIANPLASKNCGEVVEKMKTQCPSTCRFVDGSLITVSGNIDIEISYSNPGSNVRQILVPGMKIPEGACSATGRRLLNFKAECR